MANSLGTNDSCRNSKSEFKDRLHISKLIPIETHFIFSLVLPTARMKCGGH